MLQEHYKPAADICHTNHARLIDQGLLIAKRLIKCVGDS